MWPYFGTPREHIQVLKWTVSSNLEYKYIQMRSSPSLPSAGVHSPHVHISRYKPITIQIAHCTCKVPRYLLSTTPNNRVAYLNIHLFIHALLLTFTSSTSITVYQMHTLTKLCFYCWLRKTTKNFNQDTSCRDRFWNHRG